MTQTVVSDEPPFFDCLTHFTLLKCHGSAYGFKNTPFYRVEACMSTPKDIPFLICKVSFPTVRLVPNVSWIGERPSMILSLYFQGQATCLSSHV